MIQEWRDDAECAGRAPLFDASVDGETAAQRANRHAVALGYCGRCIVRAKCREDVIPGVDDGVRGGEVLVAIASQVKPTKKRVRYPREHGSERGYNQHRNRQDLPACRECLEAHTAYLADTWKVA